MLCERSKAHRSGPELLNIRPRHIAMWVIPQNTILLALAALLLGMPVHLWLLIGLGLGLANALVIVLLWRDASLFGNDETGVSDMTSGQDKAKDKTAEGERRKLTFLRREVIGNMAFILVMAVLVGFLRDASEVEWLTIVPLALVVVGVLAVAEYSLRRRR